MEANRENDAVREIGEGVGDGLQILHVHLNLKRIRGK